MKAFAIIALLLATLTVAALAGVFEDSWRYRMTVVVETPEGIKTGSAVREVTRQKGIHLTPEMMPHVEVKGEAVVIDLGKHGVLFMLIDGDYGADILFKMFPGKDKKGQITLTQEEYPNFVRFRDLSDPKTVENVRRTEEQDKFKNSDPRRPVIDFQNAFGSGVSIKEVTIEITSDSVTWRIENYLPWLKNIYGYLSGKHISGPEWYERLDSGDFQRRPR